MGLKFLGGMALTAVLLTGCGGGGSDNTTPSVPSDDLSNNLPIGESLFTTMKDIQSALNDNEFIKADQDVVFILPEDNQVLTIDGDLVVMGSLTVK